MYLLLFTKQEKKDMRRTFVTIKKLYSFIMKPHINGFLLCAIIYKKDQHNTTTKILPKGFSEKQIIKEKYQKIAHLTIMMVKGKPL